MTELSREMLAATYHYTSVTNEHIREAALRAGEEAYRRPVDLWFGSLERVLIHLAGAQQTWYVRLTEGVSPPRLPGVEDFPTLQALVERWRASDAGWEQYVAGLSEADLRAAVKWTNTAGRQMALPVWQILMHLAFHGAETRAQAALALTALGVPHGAQDFYPVFLPPVTR